MTPEKERYLADVLFAISSNNGVTFLHSLVEAGMEDGGGTSLMSVGAVAPEKEGN